MPRVYLTQEAKEAARRGELSRALGDALAMKKHRERKSEGDLAKEAGIARQTMDKLLRGENVRVEVLSMWKFLEMAGMHVQKVSGTCERVNGLPGNGVTIWIKTH